MNIQPVKDCKCNPIDFNNITYNIRYKKEFDVQGHKISLSRSTIIVFHKLAKNGEADNKKKSGDIDGKSLADRAIVLSNSVEKMQTFDALEIFFRLITTAAAAALIALAVFAGIGLASIALSVSPTPLVINLLTAIIILHGIKAVAVELNTSLLNKKKYQREVKSNFMELGKFLSQNPSLQKVLTDRMKTQQQSEEKLKDKTSPEELSQKERIVKKKEENDIAIKEITSLIESYNKIKLDNEIVAGIAPLLA